MEVGGEGDYYTYRYTVTTRMTPALRRAVVRAILIFHNWEGQSHKTVSRNHNFGRERKAEADSNRSPSAYHPNALPRGQTGSQYGGGGRGRLYTNRYAVTTTRMTPALRRAAMRAVLTFR